MKRYKLLLFFFIALMSGYKQKVDAQVHLTIDSLINFPDTALAGQAYPIAIRVKNIGNQPFQGPIQIGLMRDSLFAYLYYSNNPSTVIYPNDTLTLYSGNGVFGFAFDSSVFRPGNNVVVVWPLTLQGSVIVDTLSRDVYVNYTTSLNFPDAENSILLIPNPVESAIVVIMPRSICIERVRIFNLQGEIIYEEGKYDSAIAIDSFLPGIYLFEGTLSNGNRFYQKFFKE